jgi:hypothetical protein
MVDFVDFLSAIFSGTVNGGGQTCFGLPLSDGAEWKWELKQDRTTSSANCERKPKKS